jgi:hypothetical protein
MLKVKKKNMVAMVIYLHFTRKKQYIGIEKAIFHEFFYYIYHLNMINSNLQHKYVYLKQISDIFIKY